MKKNNIPTFVLLISACAVIIFLLMPVFKPVKIIAVHNFENYSSVLVEHFPLTDRGKIEWWLKNKNNIKVKYNIPKPAHYGGYDVTFWDFGNGYQKEGKQDRLCFYDMNTNKNCIDKDAVFSVKKYPGQDMLFITYEGRYTLKPNGEIKKIENDNNDFTAK